MAKFKVGDRVRYNGPTYTGPLGKTGVVLGYSIAPYVEVGMGITNNERWFFEESECSLDVPSAAPTPQQPQLFDNKPVVETPVQRSNVIRPTCPGCGQSNEFNYVGFSTVECVRWQCKHYNGDAALKALRAGT